jgi:hypothetical protein
MLSFPAWCLALFIGFITFFAGLGFVAQWLLERRWGRPPDAIETTRHRWSIDPRF